MQFLNQYMDDCLLPDPLKLYDNFIISNEAMQNFTFMLWKQARFQPLSLMYIGVRVFFKQYVLTLRN